MILCCGEALIDMLPARTVGGEAAFVPHCGGAIFNSAIALGRLGAKAGLFSGLSRDLFGQQLRRALAESNVDTSLAVSSDRPTTLAFVSLAGGNASYVFYDENTAGRMVSIDDLPDLGSEVRALLFGGISLISEPCGSAYEALLAREYHSRVTMLDPNLRPDFVPDPQAHDARLRRMIAMADIVKVSDDDLAWFGEKEPHEAIARRWLEAGPRLIVVTSGERGATAFTKRLVVSVPAKAVQVADTVGAGDTFNAALLAALDEAGNLSKERLSALEEAALADALAFAARAAAITVSRRGANPPWRREIA